MTSNDTKQVASLTAELARPAPLRQDVPDLFAGAPEALARLAETWLPRLRAFAAEINAAPAGKPAAPKLAQGDPARRRT